MVDMTPTFPTRYHRPISMNDDTQPHDYQRQIDALLERRRIAQARPLLSRALEQFPDDIELQLSAAWMESLADQPEEAARWCRRVLEQEPTSERARYLMTGICEDLGDRKQAESLYQSLLRDFPNDVDYLAGFSLLLFRTVHHDRARVLAEHAMSIDPDNRQARQAAFLNALLDGDRARMDAIVQTVMTDDPDSIHNARTLLILLEERRQYSEGLRLARNLLRAQPDNPDIVESVIDLTHKAHWSMAPLRWMDDYTEATVGAGVVGIGLLAWEGSGPMARTAGAILLTFTLYCWAWPPLLKFLIKR